jgi:hypothetical protein
MFVEQSFIAKPSSEAVIPVALKLEVEILFMSTLTLSLITLPPAND